MVRSHRANNDRVEIARFNAALRSRNLGGFNSHIGSGHVRGRNVALVDASPFQDPLVGGIHHLLQVLICQ